MTPKTAIRCLVSLAFLVGMSRTALAQDELAEQVEGMEAEQGLQFAEIQDLYTRAEHAQSERSRAQSEREEFRSEFGTGDDTHQLRARYGGSGFPGIVRRAFEQVETELASLREGLDAAMDVVAAERRTREDEVESISSRLVEASLGMVNNGDSIETLNTITAQHDLSISQLTQDVQSTTVASTYNTLGDVRAVAIVVGQTSSTTPGPIPEVAFGVGWTRDHWEVAVNEALEVLNGERPEAQFATQDPTTTDGVGTLDDGTPVQVWVVCSCTQELPAGVVAMDPLDFIAFADRSRDSHRSTTSVKHTGLCCAD